MKKDDFTVITPVHTCTCMYTCMYMYTHMCNYMYIYTCTCTHVYTCTCIYNVLKFEGGHVAEGGVIAR